MMVSKDRIGEVLKNTDFGKQLAELDRVLTLSRYPGILARYNIEVLRISRRNVAAVTACSILYPDKYDDLRGMLYDPPVNVTTERLSLKYLLSRLTTIAVMYSHVGDICENKFQREFFETNAIFNKYLMEYSEYIVMSKNTTDLEKQLAEAILSSYATELKRLPPEYYMIGEYS